MKQVTVTGQPVVIPAGTVLKLSEFEVKRREHLLEKLRTPNTYRATHAFQLKVGTKFSVDIDLVIKSGDGAMQVKDASHKKQSEWVNDTVSKQNTITRQSKKSAGKVDETPEANNAGLTVDLE